MNKFLLILFFSALSIFSFAQIDTTERTINNPETDTTKTIMGAGILPIFNTTADANGNNGLQGQDVAALLGSSRDIFYQAMVLHFIGAGNLRFNLRGYTQNSFAVNVFGLRINNLISGSANFSTWGGMTDVIRVMETKPGLGASRNSFGDIGGSYNLPISASSFRKGFRILYGQGNRLSKERLSITYGTGMTKKGWAFSISSTVRYAAKGYVPGTSMASFAYFLGVDKKFNDKNTLSLIVFGAPRTTARASLNTDEVYALTGDKHYNSNWGYQNGQLRNASNTFSHIPTAILTDNIVLNDHSKLTINGSYSFGRTASTAFNYFGLLTPVPTYYKYMPSYFGPTSTDADPGQYAALTNAWQNNTANPASGFSTSQQIAWDDLYNFNSKNKETTRNVDGIAGKTYTGNRSLYILEERRQDSKNWAGNAIYNTSTKNNIYLTGGANGMLSQTRYYKVVNDLLGGDYWLDLNQFANSVSTSTNVIQNNVNDPYKIVKQGDVFGYDYNINVTRIEAWGQAEKSFKKFDAYVGASISTTYFYRDGHMVNGLFPNTIGGDGSSGGRSKELSFLNYGVKGGITYKINGHNYITINVMSETKPPLPTASFVSPHTRNDVIPGLQNEKILSGDITYNLRWRWLRGRITYYYTQMNDQSWQRSYYDDVYKTNVNYYMTNLNQLNQGVELGLEGIVTKRISIIGALNYGSYLYTNRPTATISADNTAALLASNKLIYLKNYHVGGAPEIVSSLGVRYNGKKNWFAGVYVNYFANNYVTINPDRRTAEAIAKYLPSDPQIKQITDQEKLADTYTFDFMGGKSFIFKNNKRLNFSLIMNNITNNIFKTVGQEQLRHDVNNITKFPNQYAYSYGITFNASVSFTFN